MALAKRLRFEVVTPHGQALKTEVDAVSLTSVKGEFEVLPGHLPVLVALRAGPLRYRSGTKTFRAALGEGFAEARSDTVIVLADAFVEAAAVNADEARSDLAAAEEKVKTFAGMHDGSAFSVLARERDWANARIDAHREEQS